MLESAKIHATTSVRVDLAPTGALVKASVYKSSGYAVLDDAAVRGAHFMTFSPETVACQHVGGSYVVDVEFDPNQR